MNPDLAILTFDFAPTIGGVQTYLFEIAQRLGKKYEVCVISSISEPLEPTPPFQRLHTASTAALDFWRMLRGCQPNHILIGHAHTQLLIAGSLYREAHFATLTHGNDYLAAQKSWRRSIFNRLLVRSQPLLTNTHANAHRLEALGFPCPIVIYPGTDPQRFCPTDQRYSTSPVLLTVGRLVPRKGVDTVLRALRHLLPAYPDLQYHIVGKGPDQGRLERLAQKLAITGAVQFLGQIPDAHFPEAYQAADLFVMPVRELSETASVEGFGIVYLEASASGLPVIAGRSGGAVEAVRDGETGFLVEPDNPQALALTISTLLDDLELRKRMGTAGRKWVESEMNWDRATRQMETALGLDS